jgi:hypothetical protein
MNGGQATASPHIDRINQGEMDALLAREREIETARRAMVKAWDAGDIDGAREFQKIMYALIGERTPEQIAYMEARLPEPWRS